MLKRRILELDHTDMAVIITGIVCVMSVAILYFAFVNNGGIDDKSNYGIPITLDLPINVTRIVQHDDTTFLYQARGDEESIIFSGIGNTRVIQNPKGNIIEIFPTWDLRLSQGLDRPVLEMMIIRDNGTRETYSLPTRGR